MLAEPGKPLPEPVAATALPQCAKGKRDDRVADTPGPDETQERKPARRSLLPCARGGAAPARLSVICSRLSRLLWLLAWGSVRTGLLVAIAAAPEYIASRPNHSRERGAPAGRQPNPTKPVPSTSSVRCGTTETDEGEGTMISNFRPRLMFATVSRRFAELTS